MNKQELRLLADRQYKANRLALEWLERCVDTTEYYSLKLVMGSLKDAIFEYEQEFKVV